MPRAHSSLRWLSAVVRYLRSYNAAMPDGSSRLEIEALRPWISFQFTPSSGPGGQNVNKVSTRAVLLLDFAACPLFSEDQAGRIRSRLASRLDREGRLRIAAQSERNQSANRDEAERRLLELLAGALRDRKKRRATRPTAGSRERRIKRKKRRGEIKKTRRSQGLD